MDNLGRVCFFPFPDPTYLFPPLTPPRYNCPDPPKVAYAASKGAIRSLTLPLTRDLSRHGIRVVTIAPSLFDSRMTAMMSDKVRSSLTRVMEFPGSSFLPFSHPPLSLFSFLPS